LRLCSMCLSAVVTKLSVILDVPPPRLLLLREDVELDTDATVAELGLGIADIIGESPDTLSGSGVRGRTHFREIGCKKSGALSQYPHYALRKIRFHFDGHKVTERQTPAQLDMEDGDIIEVWT
uniref:NFATC2-interacting protein n=1 Tax=Salarias fasciatus TaxID=181472 RepID=A0A672HKM6_SALFA